MLLQCDSYRDFLANELTRRMRANSRYSLRAFARSLKLSPGELSEILRGMRPLTLKSAQRVAEALSLSPGERTHLFELVASGTRALQPKASPTRASSGAALTPMQQKQLSLDLFYLVSDWYCFPILSLAECEGFRSEPRWIAGRLGVSVIEARTAIERLLRLGLLETKSGELKPCPDYVVAGDQVPSEAIRAFHRQILQKALDALDIQPLSEREFTGAGFATDPKHVPEIRRELSRFLDRIVQKYSRGKKSEVYHLELSLFRLSKPAKRGLK